MAARELLLLLACTCVRGGVLTAKEYICKDPDTGSLHTANTTWRSTSFCGNYHCKLRKVDPTAPKIVINVTDEHARTSHNDSDNDDANADAFSLSRILPEISKDNDRLLNKDEIEKITELLHTVKKSDLQAVIELYNVAQDIYKEMDGDTQPQKEFDAAQYSESKSKDPLNTITGKTSYFYESEDPLEKVGDMRQEGSEHRTTTTYPARSQYQQPFYYSQFSQYPSYFTGSLLSNNDFGRIGYNEPARNPASRVSYHQRRNAYGAPGVPPQSPCPSCPGTYQVQAPVQANVAQAYPQGVASNYLLPYSYPSYNYSAHGYTNYNSNYYKGNPWAYYDYYRNYPYTVAALAQRNPEMSEGKSATDENDKSWKTDPLSDSVIAEIRANIAERGKLINIPLKKRLKLERVAKVTKTDSLPERKVRSVTNLYDLSRIEKISDDVNGRLERESEEQLETYIEKVMCEPPSEPGYFRMGNMTQPYPYCCPEKIEDGR